MTRPNDEGSPGGEPLGDPATDTDDSILRRLSRTTLEGDLQVDLEAALQRYELASVEPATECASGDPFEGHWRGMPLVELLSRADPDATHLLVESEDGFRACVPLADAVDGILAVKRVDGRGDGLPRLVVPSILGTRMVKRVERIETRRLSPAQDPEELERIDPTDVERDEP